MRAVFIFAALAMILAVFAEAYQRWDLDTERVCRGNLPPDYYYQCW